MIPAFNVILKLIDRYDYGGALELLSECGLENTDAAILMDSCRYAVNFDFKTARQLLYNASDELLESKDLKALIRNLNDLVDGEPEAIFSELMENVKFQIVNEEYIDFLGRIYRFKEAVMKYMFAIRHANRTRFSFHLPLMSKRYILKTLRKQYKIFNSSLIFAITTYFYRNAKEEKKTIEIVRLLNSEKMLALIDLRNESIVGHGFVGVSVDDIYRVYGNPYNILDDFRVCLEHLDIQINRYKYAKINDLIKEQLEALNRMSHPKHTSRDYTFE